MKQAARRNTRNFTQFQFSRSAIIKWVNSALTRNHGTLCLHISASIAWVFLGLIHVTSTTFASLLRYVKMLAHILVHYISDSRAWNGKRYIFVDVNAFTWARKNIRTYLKRRWMYIFEISSCNVTNSEMITLILGTHVYFLYNYY